MSSAIIDGTRERFLRLLGTIGRAGLNSIYPNDFEYYACALEITNSKDEVVDTLVFPVMPSSISESHQPVSNIKKTAAGVVSLFNPSFSPFPINLSGSFGRKLRILTNTGVVALGAIRSKITKEEPLDGYESQDFNLQVKTGYGVMKRLHKIYLRSYSLDSTGNPHRVYFYNMALNSSNLVEIQNLTYTQDQNSNMIWNYNLSMKAIAPAYSTRKNVKASVINVLSSSVINQTLDGLMNDFSNLRGKNQKNVRF